MEMSKESKNNYSIRKYVNGWHVKLFYKNKIKKKKKCVCARYCKFTTVSRYRCNFIIFVIIRKKFIHFIYVDEMLHNLQTNVLFVANYIVYF